MPKTALSGLDNSLAPAADVLPFASRPFVDPDPYGQFTYTSRLDALRGISDILHRPLARLADNDLAFVNALVDRTLDKATIKKDITDRFSPKRQAATEETEGC